MPNFSLNWKFWFLEQISQKRLFPLRSRKSKNRYQILYFWISLAAKFQLKLKTLNFGPNLPKKYAVYIFGICCISLTNNRTNILTKNNKKKKKKKKNWKYDLFTDYIQRRDQKSKNFERIRKNVSGGKGQLQYVLWK